LQEIIPTKIVWESPNISEDKDAENHKIFIRDMGNEYRIDSMGAYATFDKTEKMLNGIIHAVNKYGTLISGEYNAPHFHALINGRKTYLPLVQIVAGIHNNVPHSTFKGKRFFYRDHNHRNLHTNNIWCSGCAVDMFTELGQQYIIIVCVKRGKRHFAITNYSPELFTIINTRNWYYDSGSQEITAMNNKKLKHFVWAFHKKGATNNNIDDILNRMSKEFNPDNFPSPKGSMLVIDHKVAEDEKWDNRIENLQVITFSLNVQKLDCTSRIKDGCFYVPIDDGEVYGKYANKTLSVYYRNSEFTSNELDKLKKFCKNGELPSGCIILDRDSTQAMEIMQNCQLRTLLREYGESAIHRTHHGNFFDCT